MKTSLRIRTNNTYSEVYNIAKLTKKVLEELHMPLDIIKRIEITEKADTKFGKPSSPYPNVLYLFTGGWRLVGQDKNKKIFDSIEIFGQQIDKEGFTLYAPASTALLTIQSSEGHIVAEVIDENMVNILFNICDIEENKAEAILKGIFTLVVQHYYKLDIDKLKIEAEEKKANAVAAFLLTLASKELKNIEKSIQSNQEIIDRYEESIKDLITKRMNLMAQAEHYKAQTELGYQKINEELLQVKSLDKVEDVIIDNEREEIVVILNDIYIHNAGKRHYIGKFKLHISPADVNVRFENINNCRKSWWGPRCHHPHVSENGSPCWGNAGTAVTTYIKQCEFHALVSLLIAFLESVNTSDPAGKNITSWDIVDSQGRVIQKGYDYRNPPANPVTYVCYGCQEVFAKSSIALSKGNIHICTDCIDEYFTCPECGDIHKKDDAEECEECGKLICEDCYDENSICGECKEKKRRQELLDSGMNLCPFCDSIISDDELLTCETCGEQGCSSCIQFDGRYSCPNHR